jgi:hypothetical protein
MLIIRYSLYEKGNGMAVSPPHLVPDSRLCSSKLFSIVVGASEPLKERKPFKSVVVPITTLPQQGTPQKRERGAKLLNKLLQTKMNGTVILHHTLYLTQDSAPQNHCQRVVGISDRKTGSVQT